MPVETFETQEPCGWCGSHHAYREDGEELCALCGSTRHICGAECGHEEKVA